MSGSVPGGVKAEPNLTPILDMVFQLITFFMLVMNFKAAEIDQSLMLPVLGSAKPLVDSEMRVIVLNVQIATKCPHPGCDSYATLRQDKDEAGNVSYVLHCEHGHDTPFPQGAITNGKTALSVFGHICTKESGRDDNHPSITQFIINERKKSCDLATPKLTEDEVCKDGKELPDTVVLRADATCPAGAVQYIITECQKQGYRKFALKTGSKPPPAKG
jgi:biopolymer transport protein ExbD